MVFCYDVREMGKPLWTLSAHTKATSAMSCNPVIPHYLATVSSDKQLKLWSLDNNQPTCIYSTKTKLTLFDVSFYSESPFLLAAGGKGEQETGADPRDIVHILNTAQLSEVRQKFELQ
jgi:WD40 repeat protein